jgi:glycosyltransferase involved in cell wall biosynthesis
MAKVAILSQCITHNDAVSNDAKGMQRALTALGHEVRLFAHHTTVCEPRVRHALEILTFLSDDSCLLIYHHTVGWEAIVPLLNQIPCRKVMRYHNVTPSHFYEGIHNATAEACALGRRQMEELAQARWDLYFADSEYNARELLAAGAPTASTVVVPPFHQIDYLDTVLADPEVLSRCSDGKANLLFVGRLVPNKRHEALIDAFAVYHGHYNPNSRLILVGRADPSFMTYTLRVQKKVQHLGLQEAVMFTGEASDQALKAYYLVADAFLTASEHEGFCVPLVEAMALRVPVVACGFSAVPETLGDAGIVWEQPDSYLLAASVARLVCDESVREALVERGWRRYREHFDIRQIEKAFLRALTASPVISSRLAA